MLKRFNQSRAKAIAQAGKSDDEELIDLGQYLRTLFSSIKVQREWYIVWAPDGSFLRVQEILPRGCKYRHPDIMVFEKLEGNKMGKLLCCIEVDGSVHDGKALSETVKRNKEYIKAQVPLCVISKAAAQRNIWAEAEIYVRDLLCQK